MRTKTLGLLLVCLLLFVNCKTKFNDAKTKLNDAKATDIIKKTIKLTEKDKLEILGISLESKNVALVKFKINEDHASIELRKYKEEWQLDRIQFNSGE